MPWVFSTRSIPSSIPSIQVVVEIWPAVKQSFARAEIASRPDSPSSIEHRSRSSRETARHVIGPTPSEGDADEPFPPLSRSPDFLSFPNERAHGARADALFDPPI